MSVQKRLGYCLIQRIGKEGNRCLSKKASQEGSSSIALSP
jgi:hypothetical protein